MNLKTSLIGLSIILLPICLTQSCKTPAIIATQTIQKADQYNNEKNYDQAATHYKEYIKLSKTLGVYRNNPILFPEASSPHWFHTT